MATLFNTKISATYVGLIKTIDNAVISASLKELTDGSGNQTGLYVNNAGDFKVTNVLEWGSLKDTGENITITKLVDQADGIANNNNDTSLPTSKAVKDYVDTKFSQTDTLQEVLTFGNTTSGTDIAVSANDDITFTDSSKILMGAGSDLQIYHDSSNSFIRDTGTGDLKIQSNRLWFQSSTGEAMGRFTENGSAELYYDNVLRLSTTNTGVDVTGDLVVSGTITGSGGSFLPLAGGTMTGNIILNDNVKSIYGTSSDGLEIFHDSSNSYIQDTGTGNLYIQGSDNVFIRSVAGETYARFTNNGSVELNYDNSKKFETLTGGAKVTGDLTVTGSITGSGGSFLPLAGGNMTGNTTHNDNVRAQFGASNDLQIYHDSNVSFVRDDGTGGFFFTTNGDAMHFQDNTGEYMAKFVKDGAVELYYDNSKKLETTTNGVTVTGSFTTTGNINSGGHVYVTDGNKFIAGSGEDLQIYHDGSDSYISDQGTGELKLLASSVAIQSATGNEYIAYFAGTGGQTASLYAGNSKKFETTSTGISVTGNVVATESVRVPDGKFLSSGDSNDLTLTHTSTEAIISNYTGAFRIDQRAVTESMIFRVSDANAVDTTALTISRNADASFGRNVTIAGDLTVNGTTTTINTQTLAVEDPLIELAKDNAANSVDIGFYGKYNDGTARYLGLFSDASDSNKFKLFKGLTTEPTTTVDIGGTGYVAADLVVAGLEASNDVSIVKSSAVNLRVSDGTQSVYVGSSGQTRFGLGTGSSIIQSTGAAFGIGTQDGFGLRFGTNNTDALTFDTSQNASFTGDVSLPDNKKLFIGTGNDLQISHDASDSYINNLTGDLTIKNLADDKDIIFQSDNGSGGTTTYFRCKGDESITQFVKDSNHQDNTKATFGTSFDLQIYHDSNNSYITDTGTGNLLITSDGASVQINKGTTENMAEFITDGAVKLYYDSVKKFETTSTGVTITSEAVVGNGTNGLQFSHSTGNSSGIINTGFSSTAVEIRTGNVQRMLINSTAATFAGDVIVNGGNLGVGMTPTEVLDIKTTSGDCRMRLDAPSGSDTEVKFFNAGAAQYTIGHDDDSDEFRIATTNVEDPMLSFTKTKNATFAGDVTVSGNDNSIATGNSGTIVTKDANDYVRITANNSNAQLGLFRSGSAAGGMYIGANANQFSIMNDSFSSKLEVSQSGAINSDGNITTNGASVVNSGESIAAYFNGTGSSYTQGAIALQSSNADTPEARGQGVFMHNQGKDTTWYTGTRYNDADQFIIGHATGVSLNTEAARTNNAFVTVNNAGNVGIGTDNPDSKITIQNDAATSQRVLNIYHNNVTANGYASIGAQYQRTNRYVESEIRFGSETLNGACSYLGFVTGCRNDGANTEKMRITSDGHLLIGGTAIQAVGAVTFDKSAVGYTITNNTTSSAGNGHEFQVFRYNSTQIGSIVMNGTTATQYATSSDYRLKEDLQDFAGLDMVSRIPVYDFKWKTDESRSYGVMAHELQEVLPQAVVGEKDAEEMQSVDYSKIVPLLVKSIQELKKEIEDLKCKCKN